MLADFETLGTVESLLRATLGLFALLVPLLISAWLWAGLKARPRLFEDWACRAILFGWAQILLGFELLGHLGCLSFWSLALLNWFLCGAAFLYSRVAGKSETPSAFEQEMPAAPDNRSILPLVLMTSLLALGPWIRQLDFPPVLEDSLTYHLSFPAEWLNTETLRMPIQHDADMGPTYYPFAAEALLGFWMLVFGTDQFATGSALLSLAVLLLVLLDLRHVLNASAVAAAVCWALLATSPLVVWLTLVAFNDLWLAAALCLALRAALRLHQEPTSGRAVETGVALGLTVAVKYSGLVLGAGVALVTAAALISVSARESGAKAVRLLLVLFGVAFLVGGYPYLRNLWLTGSPLWPSHVEIFGLRLFEGLYSAADWTNHAHHRFDLSRYLFTGPGLAQVGAVLVWGLFPLSLAALIVLARSRGWIGLLTGASGWLGLLAFWFFSPYRHDPRFYVPGAALLTVSCLPLIQAVSVRMGRSFLSVFALILWASFIWSGFGLSRKVELAAAAIAYLAGIALHSRLQGLRLRAAHFWALLILFAALLALAQPGYVREKMQRWEGIYEGQRGRIWAVLERSSPAEGFVVAAAGTSNTYPLYGQDLRNRVVFVPRNANIESFVYDWGRPFRSVFENPSPERWLENLRRLEVDRFVLGPAGSPEREWIAAHPEVFRLEHRAGGYSLYIVLPEQ